MEVLWWEFCPTRVSGSRTQVLEAETHWFWAVELWATPRTAVVVLLERRAPFTTKNGCATTSQSWARWSWFWVVSVSSLGCAPRGVAVPQRRHEVRDCCAGAFRASAHRRERRCYADRASALRRKVRYPPATDNQETEAKPSQPRMVVPQRRRVRCPPATDDQRSKVKNPTREVDVWGTHRLRHNCKAKSRALAI